MNNKNSAIFLATVLVAGIIGISSPFAAFGDEYKKEYKKYDSYDPYKPDKKYDSYDPYKPDKKYDSYDPYKPDKKYSKPYDYYKMDKNGKPNWSYQGAKCDNTNVNLNNIDQSQIQEQFDVDGLLDLLSAEDGIVSPQEAMDAITSNGNGMGNGDSQQLLNAEGNIINVCINDNENDLWSDFGADQEQSQGQGN